MKTKVTVEQCVCDFCGKETYAHRRCMICGKDCCEDHLIDYQHGVYACGTGDGFFCLECDKEARKSGNALWNAYQEIQKLRDECDAWEADFKARANKAEEKVKALAPSND